MPASVLCILTAWPDILAKQHDEQYGLGWWLAQAIERDEAHCETYALERLQPRDLAEVVRSRAPATEAAVAGAFADRADGNPLVLEALLNAPQVARATEGGRIALAEGTVREFDNDFPAIMLATWEGLPLEVREALCLCTLQGREAV